MGHIVLLFNDMKSIQDYYSKGYKAKSTQDFINWTDKQIRSNFSFIPYVKNHKVLDIACGISSLGKMFGDHVTGIDLNIESIKKSRANGIHAVHGDVENKWPVAENYFDIVIASHIIEHLQNPDKMLMQSKRVLKRGGKLIIWTPNLAAWFNRIFLLIGYQPFFTEISTIDNTLGMPYLKPFHPIKKAMGHIRVPTLPALIDLIELHGFRIVSVSGSLFYPFPKPLRLVDKLFSYVPSLASTIAVVAEKP